MFSGNPIETFLLLLLPCLPLIAFIIARLRAGRPLAPKFTAMFAVYHAVFVVYWALFLFSADEDQVESRILPLGCCAVFIGPILAGLLLAEGSRIAQQSRAAPKCELCESCGYNLTGNVSGICPECGRPINWQPDMDLFTEDPAKQAEEDLGDGDEPVSDVNATRHNQRD